MQLIRALIDSFPRWTGTAAALIALFFEAVLLALIACGALKVVRSMNREERVSRLTEALHEQKDRCRSESEAAAQALSVVASARSHMYSLNQRRGGSREQDISDLIQRIVEAVASDMKHRPGERHRCGLWIESDGKLTLSFASAGFPFHYLRKRQLDVNRSVAGTAFRMQRALNRPAVRSDEDWEPNRESDSPYASLIAIPFDFGVLTIDALGSMTEEDVLIAELYGSIIEAA